MPTSRFLPSGVPNTSAGIGPVLTRHVSDWLARSTATSSSLSCMLTKAVVLLLSIQMWLGVLAVAIRLASCGSLPSQR